MVIIISGVSGAGKTTVGRSLAEDLGWNFFDADDFHSPANITKMSAGVPLDDDDRRDWLRSLRDLIEVSNGKGQDIVLACSALKQTYRDYLCSEPQVKIVLLQADFATIENRLKLRENHFMTSTLLKSQFETLEESDERLLVIDATRPITEIVQTVISEIS